MIVLNNGRRIEVDRAWLDGAQVRYEKGGGTYGVPRSLVKSIEKPGAVPPPPSPPPGAVAPRRPAPAALAGPQFRLRYEGAVDEELGMAVLRILAAAYDEHARRLGLRVREPITVVLQTAASLPEGAPAWAASVNDDGNIRVPVAGFERATPRLTALIRHELAHTFLRAATGGNCPTWLQEGVSQWLEGGDPAREDHVVAAALAEGRLFPLLTLEAPFQVLPADAVAMAYAESLSAVAHVLRLRGEAGVVRLLAALGDRVPSEEALPTALALSYPELQKSWELHLRKVPARP